MACRLALVLAMDVSSSVNAEEDALQRGGLASALVSPAVMDAFFASPAPVALAIFEWSGRYNQADLLPWTMIATPADLLAASETIRTSTRSHNDFPTAMGYALGHAAGKLDKGPICDYRTIDIAGDGINNDGFGPTEAYAAFPFDDVTVNGLVVDTDSGQTVAPYFETTVIRGPLAFVEVAQGFSDYAATMERKLIRELSVLAIGALHKPRTAG